MGMGGGNSENFGQIDNLTRGSYQPNMNAGKPNMVYAAKPGAQAGTGVTGPARGNVFKRSAMDMNAARGLMGNPGQLRGDNLAGYMNPYTQGAINATMGDINRNRQMQTNDIGAAATRAGAFGGSRHGVADALTNEAAGRQMANTAANMRNNAWGQAQGAAQFDIGNRMAAGQGLANLSQQGFGYGQAIGQQQMQQGAMQQALQQELINAGKNQFQNKTNSPAQSLQYPLQALGVVPYGQQTTETKTPGLFDIMSLGMSFL